MPRKIYDPKIKAAFISAAIVARSAGKTWNEALDAAKAEGYTGSRQGILKMIGDEGKRKGKGKRGRKPGVRTSKPGVRGRKKGLRGRRKSRGASLAAAVGTHFEPIQAMIDKIVQDRVRGVLDRAIAELQNARNQ